MSLCSYTADGVELRIQKCDFPIPFPSAQPEKKNRFHPYLSHTESENGHTSPRCVRELQSVGGLRTIGMSFYTHIIHYRILLEKKKKM